MVLFIYQSIRLVALITNMYGFINVYLQPAELLGAKSQTILNKYKKLYLYIDVSKMLLFIYQSTRLELLIPNIYRYRGVMLTFNGLMVQKQKNFRGFAEIFLFLSDYFCNFIFQNIWKYFFITKQP